MTDPFRVPKPHVTAEVTLSGDASRELRLYLGKRSASHSGPQRPVDLLNGSRRFLPARDPDRGLLLIRRSSILVLSYRAEDTGVTEPVDVDDLAFLDPSYPEAERRDVRVRMENGMEIRGTVVYVLPEGERRLQDYFNQSDEFIRMRDGGTVRLVNTGRIHRVEPI